MGTLFVSVLNMSLTALPLVAAVLLVRGLLLLCFGHKIPRGAFCLLWLIVALALLCPWRPQSPTSLVGISSPILGISEITSEIFTYQEVIGTQSGAAETVEQITVPDAPTTEADGTVTDGDYVTYPLQGVTPPTVSPAPPAAASRLELGAIVVWGWLIGCAGMLLWAGIRYALLRRRVDVSVPFVKGVYLCDGIDVPFLLGIFAPRIYLPSSMAGDALSHDVWPVIAHERAHIARGDHILKIVGYGVLVLHWFNPLIWLCFHLFCRDLEFACDERAVRGLDSDERRVYAEALLECSIGKGHLPMSCPLAFGEIGVRERVGAVLDTAQRRRAAAVSVALVGAVLAVCFLTTPHTTVYDILSQKGYGVTRIEKNKTLTVTIPTDVLTEDIYSAEGRTYGAGEVVVYAGEITSVYLSRIAPVKGENDLMWLYLTFEDGDLPRKGTITKLNLPKYSGTVCSGYQSYISPIARYAVYDADGVFEDAIKHGSQDGGKVLGFYIEKKVLMQADDFLSFTIDGLTDIHYRTGAAVHEDDMIVTEGGKVGSSAPQVLNGTYYVPERCLYMSVASSLLVIGGDTGYRYLISDDAFCQISRTYGDIRAIGSMGDAWQAFPWTIEEWNEMFIGGVGVPDITLYRERLCRQLSSDMYLFSMDGALWLAQIHQGRNVNMPDTVWSIYELIPEEEKGMAYHKYASAMSSSMPRMKITFALDGITQLSVSAGETASLSLTHSAETTDWMVSPVPDEAGMFTAYWTPGMLQMPDVTVQPEDGSLQVGASGEIRLTFTGIGEDGEYVGGALYIEKDEEASSPGMTYYRVRLVGTGLYLSQAEYGVLISYRD